MTLGDRFLKSKGQSIELDGLTVHMSYEKRVSSDVRALEITVVQASSRFRHGISMSAHGAKMRINGQTLQKAIVWTDTAPFPLVVELISRSSANVPEVAARSVRFWNSWDDGSGITHAWIGNAGLLIDRQSESVVRLRCSDGGGEIDFESLVLDIRTL